MLFGRVGSVLPLQTDLQSVLASRECGSKTVKARKVYKGIFTEMFLHALKSIFLLFIINYESTSSIVHISIKIIRL